MLRTSSNSVRHDAVPRDRVLAAARDWACTLRARHPEVVQVGYFGSYARGDYMPGSDFDVLLEVSATTARRRDRASPYLPEDFPVGMDLIVYTSNELATLRSRGAAFVGAIDREFTLLS